MRGVGGKGEVYLGISKAFLSHGVDMNPLKILRYKSRFEVSLTIH